MFFHRSQSYYTLFLLLFSFCVAFAQDANRLGRVTGTVLDATNRLPLEGALVVASGTSYNTNTDSLGYFSLEMPVGSVNLEVVFYGYQTLYRYNVEVSSGYEKRYIFELIQDEQSQLDEVVVETVRKTVRAASLQTPLSVQRLTSEEIVRMPGGGFDLSRVVQSLPGVASTRGSTGGYRNDIIVRGGATNENVYYLDGIEVPVINHFNTQGGSGGVEGILNVNFIEDLTLSSSAFNARYDNVLSSVFEIKQRKGNLTKLQGNVRASLIESQITLDGPIGKSQKVSYLASFRTSYLDLLFSFLDLPIRPNYIDYQTKISYQINPKTSMTFIGFGAVDWFRFVEPKNANPRKLYLLNSLPEINQSSNTFGASLQRTLEKGFFELALSYNGLNNEVSKKNTLIEGRENELIFQTKALESEIKLRSNFQFKVNGWDFSYGLGLQLPIYSSTFMQKRFTYTDSSINENKFEFTSKLTFIKYGLFAQAGRLFFNKVLSVNFGLRADANTFTDRGNEIWNTLSPRVSISYGFHPKWKANISAGIYYKLLPYNTLAYQNNIGFANQSVDYIRSTHITGGFEYLPSLTTRVTLEGFYKLYDNVPVSRQTGVSLSNIGIDYGTTGNESVLTIGKGRAYGVELFVQQKLLKNFFFILSYTYYRTLYSGIDNILKPASWDNQHIGSLSFLIFLPRDWSIGVRLQYQGAAPYTPFDRDASRVDYLSTGQGVLDYTKINANRLTPFHNGDVRVDKKWYLKNHTLNLYFLVSNFYGAQTSSYPYYSFERNDANTAFNTTDGKSLNPDGSNAIESIINNDLVTIVPSLGIIWEFR